jgi:hypothetical protein
MASNKPRPDVNIPSVWPPRHIAHVCHFHFRETRQEAQAVSTPPRTQTERLRELTWGRSVCKLEGTLPAPRTRCVSLGVTGDGLRT